MKKAWTLMACLIMINIGEFIHLKLSIFRSYKILNTIQTYFKYKKLFGPKQKKKKNLCGL